MTLEEIKKARLIAEMQIPVEDKNLCGSCTFSRPVFTPMFPELKDLYVHCDKFYLNKQIDDGCDQWKRKRV